MMMVRCILVETTRPVRIRPRIETRPVKGHFLSATRNSGQPKPFPFFILETSSMTISSLPLIPIARDVTYRRRAVDSLFVVAHRSEIGLVGSCW
jgi:hypothetical protein